MKRGQYSEERIFALLRGQEAGSKMAEGAAVKVS